MRNFEQIELKTAAGRVFATLYSDIVESNIKDYHEHWKPLLEAKREWCEDSDWDWGKKVKDHQADETYGFFSVECDGITQGLMTTSVRSAQNLIYIEYLAVAPWNRKLSPDDKPKFSLVGT